jgi:ribonuclease HI
MVHIYTDGSCLKNPGGPGGYAFCIVDGGMNVCISGGVPPRRDENEPHVTNIRMEILAVLTALEMLASCQEFTFHVDLQLVMYCGRGEWARKANTDLWAEYDRLSKGKNIDYVWVKGHSGDKFNTVVDALAYNEAILISENVKK